ncbi:MAG: glycosyltransferase [Bacteroidetes bacterium]|nr:glycosyltransferase [Bacteroidota bacterium]
MATSQKQKSKNALVDFKEMNKINILFLHKFKVIAGAEMFLIELIKTINRAKFRPMVCLIADTCEHAYDILEKEKIKIFGDLLTNNDSKPKGFLGDKIASITFIKRFLNLQGKTLPCDIKAILNLTNILKREKIHILFYIDQHAALNLAPLCAILARTPLLIGSFHTQGLRISIIEKLLLSATDKFMVTSSYHGKYLVDFLHIPSEKIKVINNGISIDRFKKFSVNMLKKENFAIDSDTSIVGIVARLVPDKCHEIFLESAVTILKVLPDTHFFIIGNGPERVRLEEMSIELNISSNVHFLGFREDIPSLLSLLDVSVLSSCAEFFPYSLLESMMMEIPVVATDVGAVSEVVYNGVTGILVPSKNSNALAEAILLLLKDRELAKKMGREGRKRVINRFSAQKMTSQIESIFQDLKNFKKIKT